jgi:hypothetical protein
MHGQDLRRTATFWRTHSQLLPSAALQMALSVCLPG